VIAFDAAHKAVHFPDDRRIRIWVRPSILAGVGVIVLLLIGTAWIQWALRGLPESSVTKVNPSGAHGFPLWVRLCHYLNFAFIMLLIRSGLSILMDHPRLYFNDHCTPGSEWLRLTPVKVPRDRIWTAKDDARYLSPFVSTPGYRHTVGIARVWHFINVHGFILTGVFSSHCCLPPVNGIGWFPTRSASFPKPGQRGCITPRSICRPSQTDSTPTTLCKSFLISPSYSASVRWQS
jgi:hypothetical protein